MCLYILAEKKEKRSGSNIGGACVAFDSSEQSERCCLYVASMTIPFGVPARLTSAPFGCSPPRQRTGYIHCILVPYTRALCTARSLSLVLPFDVPPFSLHSRPPTSRECVIQCTGGYETYARGSQRPIETGIRRRRRRRGRRRRRRSIRTVFSSFFGNRGHARATARSPWDERDSRTRRNRRNTARGHRLRVR